MQIGSPKNEKDQAPQGKLGLLFGTLNARLSHPTSPSSVVNITT